MYARRAALDSDTQVSPDIQLPDNSDVSQGNLSPSENIFIQQQGGKFSFD